jgi:hypothetical protein
VRESLGGGRGGCVKTPEEWICVGGVDLRDFGQFEVLGNIWVGSGSFQSPAYLEGTSGGRARYLTKCRRIHSILRIAGLDSPVNK